MSPAIRPVEKGRAAARLVGIAIAAVAAIAWSNGAAAAERTAFKVCADPHYLPWSNRAGEGYENRIASLLAGALNLPVEYTWFPQRMGFIRNTLRSRGADGEYKCDVVMGLPAGFELAITTEPYYHSTYALVYVKGRGLDDVESAEDLLVLEPARRDKIRFGLAERNPGTIWLAKHAMLDQIEIAYASQHGNPEVHPGQLEQEDLLAGEIDATIMWGPIAGHFARSNSGRSGRGHPDGLGARRSPALRDLRRGSIRAEGVEGGAPDVAGRARGRNRGHPARACSPPGGRGRRRALTAPPLIRPGVRAAALPA